MIDDSIEDFEDDDFGDDQEIAEIEQEQVKIRPLAGARKPRSWKSVEEYMEQRNLKIALSEDFYEYDI